MQTGCRFEGSDQPSLTATKPGTRLEIDLEFQGNLIDTCKGNQVLATATWKVQGAGTTA
jgi:hypothetical protein